LILYTLAVKTTDSLNCLVQFLSLLLHGVSQDSLAWQPFITSDRIINYW